MPMRSAPAPLATSSGLPMTSRHLARRWVTSKAYGGRVGQPDQPDGQTVGAAGREPGWYADPSSPGHWRWWDGSSFTEHAVKADRARRSAGAVANAGARPGSTGPAPEGATLSEGQLAAADATLALPAGTAASGPQGGDGRRRLPTAVLAKRWAAVVVTLALVIAVLVVVFRSHPPTLYWKGEPLKNASAVLDKAGSTMKASASADEAATLSSSRCYFTLPNQSTHDIEGQMACGPVLFPWSSPGKAWLEYPVTARPASSGVDLAVSSSANDTSTVALAPSTVLRRPDGASPPKAGGGLAVPVVPRQELGWAGLLHGLPQGLQTAPVSDVLGGWAHDYRLVAYGEVTHLPASLDPVALKKAVVPKGSSWSATGAGGRPRATVLVPAPGQVFAVAELAESPGEADGAVPAGVGEAAAGAPGAAGARLEVVGGSTAATLQAPGGKATTLFVAAAVPTNSAPNLVVSDKGLAQEVSLANGRANNVPSVLARLSPSERLGVSGHLPGVTLQFINASLVWFAGSDGGTVPPSPDEAYLQVMIKALPLSASFLPASDFALRMPGGQVKTAQALPDADRSVIVVGFLVPASFSTGTLVAAVGGRTFSVPVDFP